MLDRYWFGSVERISPEAPVPILRIEEIQERAGGAANVAMNVAALGAGCALVGVVGDDEAGQSLRGVLEQASIAARFTLDPHAQTVTKLRMVSRHQQLIRADFDTAPGAAALSESLADYRTALEGADAVILSDYGKGGLNHIRAMIEAATARAIPVLVDPKGADFERYANATIITPNIREFEAVVGPVKDDDELRDKALELIRALEIHGLLITRGDKGMVLVEREKHWFDYPPSAKEVYDVSGAGDTVIAAFGVAYALGLPDEDAVRLANAAAGVVVGKLGTATVSFEEASAVLELQRGQRGRW